MIREHRDRGERRRWRDEGAPQSLRRRDWRSRTPSARSSSGGSPRPAH